MPKHKILWPNQSLELTPGGADGSAIMVDVVIPAWLSFGR
jgi:hypothetical protein